MTLLVYFAVPATGVPSGDSTKWLESARSNLRNLRVQITFFDKDQSQSDRSVDLMVTTDDDANAEGLMNREQASRVLAVLAGDGLFDRAKGMGENAWAPPPQPFYVLWVRFDESRGIYEFRKGDAAFVALLIQIRDVLAKGLAARSVDRALAALDPKARRWPVAQPAKPAPPPMPSGSSSLHPEYSFRLIDGAWNVRESYLKPSSGIFVSSSPADETMREDHKLWFRELSYSNPRENRDCKVIVQYPSGRIYSEVDAYTRGVDLPRGDVYERRFNEEGKILFYLHTKDGKAMDAAAFDEGGAVTSHITHGTGFLCQPTFDKNICDDLWYYEGLVLLDRRVNQEQWTSLTLNDNTESGHAASLNITRDGVETLLQDGYQWIVRSDGNVRREALYRKESEMLTTAQLAEEYAAARTKFGKRYNQRVAAAGFNVKEIGFDELEALK